MSGQYDNLEAPPAPIQRKKKTPWTFISIAIVLAACAIIIPVAIVISTKHSGSNTFKASNSASSQDDLRHHYNSSNTTTLHLSPKPKWNFGNDKMIGLNLGNWLILERWMNEDWFVNLAGPNSWDEWDFTIALGQNATNALEVNLSLSFLFLEEDDDVFFFFNFLTSNLSRSLITSLLLSLYRNIGLLGSPRLMSNALIKPVSTPSESLPGFGFVSCSVSCLYI